MSAPPPPKRQKHSPPSTAATATEAEVALPPTPVSAPGSGQTSGSTSNSVLAPAPITPRPPLDTAPPPSTAPSSSTNPRKRRSSRSPKLDILPPGTSLPSETSASASASAAVSIPNLLSEDPVKKRGRTNTPWTANEEQRLKQMRDAGHSWGEIAKAFPNRTEGSVKKHWYKDMHYAEFGEDETAALRDAIREYDANKWKIIGAKLGKPAKACEQYAREHFKNV